VEGVAAACSVKDVTVKDVAAARTVKDVTEAVNIKDVTEANSVEDVVPLQLELKASIIELVNLLKAV